MRTATHSKLGLGKQWLQKFKCGCSECCNSRDPLTTWAPCRRLGLWGGWQWLLPEPSRLLVRAGCWDGLGSWLMRCAASGRVSSNPLCRQAIPSKHAWEPIAVGLSIILARTFVAGSVSFSKSPPIQCGLLYAAATGAPPGCKQHSCPYSVPLANQLVLEGFMLVVLLNSPVLCDKV